MGSWIARRWLGRLRRMFSRVGGRAGRRKSFEGAMSAELEFHIEQAAEDYIAQGMSPDKARSRARREFGSIDLAKEELRDTQRLRWLADFGRDVRYALRGFRRTPGFAATAIVVLALGIGANTAVFSLLDRVLLALLPVEDPERLVEVSCLQNLEPDEVGCTSSYPGYLTFRERSELFEDIAAFAEIENVNVLANGMGGIATGMVATGNYFELLGVRPGIGRLFSPSDDSASVPPVAVLSYSYFQRRFGADPTTIGRTVEIKGVPVIVVGVTPPGFQGLSLDLTPDITFPMVAMVDPLQSPGYLAQRDSWWLQMVIRMHPDSSVEQLQAALEPTYNQTVADMIDEIGTAVPATLADSFRGFKLDLLPAARGISSALRRDLARPLRILMGAVAIVLLIACANLAGLLLTRSATRHHEFAVRLAIGASRARIVRQVLTESLLIAALGTVAGLILATWGGDFLLRLAAGEQGRRVLDTSPDLRVFGFASAVTLISALLIGWIPAWRTSHAQPHGGLQEVRLGHSAAHWSRVLIPAQIGLASVLLMGAILFLETFNNYRQVDMGYRPEQLLTVRLFPEGAGYDAEQFRAYYDRLLPRLKALPGVTSLTTSVMSVAEIGNRSTAKVPGFVPRDFDDQTVSRNWVGTDYVETAGMRLVASRDLTETDQKQQNMAALVNESFAQHFYPDAARASEILGRSFQIGNSSYTVAGVIRDARDRGPKSPPEPTAYVPLRPFDFPRTITLRTQGANAALLPLVRDTLRQVDPAMPVTEIQEVSSHVDNQLARERLLASLSTAFGGLALLLVAVGIYGTVAGGVTARSREIGIRLALGSQGRRVVWLVVGESVLLVVTGSAAGLIAGAFLSRLIESQLYGIEPSDPVTYIVSALVLLGTAALAAFVPARRAARMDPASVLRAE